MGQVTGRSIIEEFSREERKVYKDLHALLSHGGAETITTYYAVGKRLSEAHEHAKENKKLYGAKLVDRMAKALGLTKNPLYDAQRAYEVWPTEKELTVYTKLTGPTSNKLSWTHLTVLAKVEDSHRRMEFAQECLEHEMDAKSLDRRINGKQASKDSGVKTPKSIAECLKQMKGMLGKLDEFFTDAWFGNFRLDVELGALDSEKYTQSLYDNVYEVDDLLSTIRNHAMDAQRRLAPKMDLIKEYLDVAKKAKKEDEAEGSDEREAA